MNTNPLARLSLVDQAVTTLKAEIQSGRWALGTRIPTEAELVERLGVSRNTLREAIRVLCVSGMLEVRQGDGSYVRATVDLGENLRRLGRASLREHLELRALLEAEAAALAALRRSETDLKDLDRLLAARDRHQAEPARTAFIEADLAFHRRIAQASGNRALAELYDYFCQSIRGYLQATLDDQDLPEPDQASHQAIVDAIRAGNPEAAAAAAHAVTAPVVAALNLLPH